jgi:hypothetical protein
MAKVKIMYDLARLAIETDSTRAITLMLDGVSTPALEIPDKTISDGYHNLSHHGKSEKKRSELITIDVPASSRGRQRHDRGRAAALC